jgi:AAA domain
MAQPALTIVSLEVSNVKRIRAVTIHPEGSVVILGGQNEQGKTSVLDAIEFALGGAKSLPSDPIRHGAAKAYVVADLGELVVERVITKSGTNLTVRNRAGEKQTSPQAILDKLCSRIAFDPLDFLREEPAKQNEILRRLVGLDFTASNAKREALFAARTKVNRDAKSTRAQSESLVVPPGTPDAPVNLAELLAQIRHAHEARENAAGFERQKQAARDAVTRSEEAFAAAEEAARKAEAVVLRARMARRQALTELEAFSTQPAPEPAVDVRALEGQVATAETVNRNVERKRKRDQHEADANQLDAQAAELTAQIDAVDEEQRQALAAIAYPVPGLALGEDGPTFNGVPLDQASGAQRIRISVAIGLALNPRLKVLLVRDASLLDDKSLAMVADMAAQAGAQVWLERVGTGDPGAVIIQDGQVL